MALTTTRIHKVFEWHQFLNFWSFLLVLPIVLNEVTRHCGRANGSEHMYDSVNIILSLQVSQDRFFYHTPIHLYSTYVLLYCIVLLISTITQNRVKMVVYQLGSPQGLQNYWRYVIKQKSFYTWKMLKKTLCFVLPH